MKEMNELKMLLKDIGNKVELKEKKVRSINIKNLQQII